MIAVSLNVGGGVRLIKSTKENPQKLTHLSSRSHPRHLVGKRTAQKDTTIDTTSDSQVNSHFPYRKWPYQTGKTVHVHAKHYKHEDGRTAPGVCGNGSVPLSHSGNVVTRIGIHTHKIPTRVFQRGCGLHSLSSLYCQ